MAGYRISRQLTEFGEHVRGWRTVLGLTAQQVERGISRGTPCANRVGELERQLQQRRPSAASPWDTRSDDRRRRPAQQ